MTLALLVVLAVFLLALFITARRSLLFGRAAAKLKAPRIIDPVWIGVEKRGARLWRSRFRYFRPGPRGPSLAAKIVSPLRDLVSAAVRHVPEIGWIRRAPRWRAA